MCHGPYADIHVCCGLGTNDVLATLNSISVSLTPALPSENGAAENDTDKADKAAQRTKLLTAMLSVATKVR